MNALNQAFSKSSAESLLLYEKVHKKIHDIK